MGIPVMVLSTSRGPTKNATVTSCCLPHPLTGFALVVDMPFDPPTVFTIAFVMQEVCGISGRRHKLRDVVQSLKLWNFQSILSFRWQHSVRLWYQGWGEWGERGCNYVVRDPQRDIKIPHVEKRHPMRLHGFLSEVPEGHR